MNNNDDERWCEMTSETARFFIRLLCSVVALGIVAAACGSDADSADGAVPDVVQSDEASDDSSVTTDATVADGEVATSSTDDATVQRDDGEADEPTGPWPAPALPIAEVYDFDQRIQGLESFDDQLFFFDIATMYRLDPETGEVDSFLLPRSDEHNVGPIYTTKSESHLVLAATQSDWGFDRIVGIDPIGFERTLDLTVPLEDTWAIPQANTGSGALVSVQPNFHDLDTDTMTLSSPLPFATVADAVYRDGDRVWVWRLDGTGSVFDAEGVELATLDLGRQQARFNHRVVAVGEDSIWHGDNLAAILTQFDRVTGEKVREVDLSTRYGDDAFVQLSGYQDVESGFVIVRVARGSDGWFVLLELDTTSGEVLSDHVFAPVGAEVFGSILFDEPQVEAVGERLFLRDHRRRIVEVDLDRLGQVDTAWEDSGLEQAPTLTPEEEEVAEQMLEWTVGGDVPTTDPALTETITSAQTDGGPWEILAIVIDGDRAWGELVDAAQRQTVQLVMRRSGDEWQIETHSLCLLSFNFGLNDCEL